MDKTRTTIGLPRDTAILRDQLGQFLGRKIPARGRLGSCKHGLYAFFDYDGEPIYVGQTVESLGTRIRRHLTNQRTDAVAMGVLDPFEVRTVRVWPFWPEQLAAADKDEIIRRLNNGEAQLFASLVAESKFGALLNEKPAPLVCGDSVKLPESYEADLVTPEVADMREHPDVRLARRAQTIARLAQIIAERKVSRHLRRVLLAQANRLAGLAQARVDAFKGEVDVAEEED